MVVWKPEQENEYKVSIVRGEKGTCLSEFEFKNRKWSQMAFEANILADFSYDLEMHEKFISKTYNLKYSK